MTELNLESDEKIRKEKERTKWKEMKEWIGNGIGDEGAKRISESLMINTSLTELYLDCYEKIRNEKERRKNKRMRINNE